MSKLTTNLHCDACETGIVAMTVKNTKRGSSISLSVEVKCCSLCKKYFGIKGVQGLKQVAHLTAERNVR